MTSIGWATLPFALRLLGLARICIDSWKLGENPPTADLILVTHYHHDHCSDDDVSRIHRADTVIVANPSAAKKLRKEMGKDAVQHVMKPGDHLQIAGVTVEAVPAYNVAREFHKKTAGHLGYIINVGETRIYHAGDTEPIPEMADIKADILIVPVSGRWVADPEEAAEVARFVKPKIAIPMHIGTIIGSRAEAEQSKELADRQVMILEKEKS
jgi:L-ascorbate metabolism protein UlaG (beta-lactamase superfamily)